MDDAEPVLVPGYKLDRYELLTPIASGGMASVWLARLRGKRGFEKLFAIKTIKTELTQDSRFQVMFLDEARIASAIEHPNVSQILDLGEQGDVLYIVMEWVDGDSLAKVRRLAHAKGTPLPLGLSLRILADACAGLHAAHELCDRQGKRLDVVHRDVSPHNILVGTLGNVKVIDFGVAKALDRQAGETGTGIVKGKIRYMAPEQAQGMPLDRRADVWAVGVCLYELLTGELPFDGESDVDVLRRLMSDAPPPRAGGAVPHPVEDLLARSLVRDPDARFATTADMQSAIKDAIVALKLPSTSEDLAAFLRAHLPELETKRRDAVTRALASSQRREGEAVAPTEEALAPTVLSERKPEPHASSDASTVALPASKGGAASKPKKKLKKRARPAETARAADESKLTPAASATTDERAAPPRRGLFWGVALAAAAGTAWFVWPGGARLREMISPEAPREPVVATPRPAPSVAVAPASPATATTAAARAPASSAPAAASATPSAPVAASATASASTAASAAPPDAGRHRIRRRRPPTGEEPAAPVDPDDPSPYD